jgi:IPT/TIG domain
LQKDSWEVKRMNTQTHLSQSTLLRSLLIATAILLLGHVGSTTLVKADDCGPGADEIALFRNENYSGPCLMKGIGEHRVVENSNSGLRSAQDVRSQDLLSFASVRVGANVEAFAGLSRLNVRAESVAQNGGCPPAGFNRNSPNLLHNPSFEEVGPRGRSATLINDQDVVDDRSAAAGWTMHTSNDRANVRTEIVKANRLGGGASMLHITAGSNEGGVYQLFARDNEGPTLVVASVWVFVKRGRVVLATGNQGVTPTSSLNRTFGSWELLQACSDGNTTNNWFVVYSTAVEGSDFYVDQASVSRIKPAANQCGGMMIENIVPNVTFPGGVIAINGRNFGHRPGTKLPAINRNNALNLLQVTRWTDSQILTRLPLDLVGGTYQVLIYCDDSYRTSSNSFEVTVRDDLRRPR